MRKPIHIINGPNLNLLGTREPEVYGHQSLEDIHALCEEKTKQAGYDIVFKQSNIEGELIDFIQEAGKSGSGIIITPSAYTHTSVAIHDSLNAKRESFRRRSLVAEAVTGTISGFGANSYLLGVQALINLLEAQV